RARSVALFAAAILLQAESLYLYAGARGNNPYMAGKMFYVLLYPQGVGVALALATAWRFVARLDPGAGRPESRTLRGAAWAVVVVGVMVVARPLIGAPKSLVVAKHPATSFELGQ